MLKLHQLPKRYLQLSCYIMSDAVSENYIMQFWYRSNTDQDKF